MKKATVEDAIYHIEALYPPDSQYPRTAAIGKYLLESSVGLDADPNKWRDLSEEDLMSFAEACLIEEGEDLQRHGF